MNALVYIGIGSNLNDPVAQVQRAITALAHTAGVCLLRHSPWYRTEPLGPPGQEDYINGVAELETQLEPEELLHALQAIEQQQGRVRLQRWGSRTLDLDILLYGNRHIDTPTLTIPHREIAQRNFVLCPLADLSPELIFPDGRPLQQLLANCPSQGIVRLSDGSNM